MLQEQVRTLRALNMNYIDDEGELGAEEAAEATEGGDADGGDGGADAGGAQLERLLLSKNRRLEAELVSIRNELHGAQAGLSGNERHSQSLERIVSEQRRLFYLEIPIGASGALTKRVFEVSIAARRILKTLLYWNEGVGSPFLGGIK